MKKIPLEYHRLSKVKKKIIIIGSNSTLAKEFIKFLNQKDLLIFKISKKDINFSKNYKSIKLFKMLKNINPDIILNCVGKFALNKSATEELLVINVLPTWELIKFYMKNKPKKKVNLIVLGSSSYKSPRKKYMMYSASKVALYRLVKSAEEFFIRSNFKIKIFNPSTFGGKHINTFKKKPNDNIYLVAKKVYSYINKFL